MSSRPHAVGYLDELRQIVPTEQIEPQLDGDEGGGSWAVEPATQVELVEVLRWANQRHAAVFTRHPRRSDAQPPFSRRPRIYLRGRRMKRVKDLDVVSGTITVQSGITMAELDELLGERSFTTGFPTRPWRQESLGAVLAAALDAHWGPRYGAMESEVVSLGVVFPDGTAAGGRGAPRRAVGPDFDRLFLGSRGRFGIIYEATLRIYPSAGRVALSYAAPDLATALATVHAGLLAGLDPRAVEIVTPAPDREWGKKRVGLTAQNPVLVLVEPWGPIAGRPVSWVDDHFAEKLVKLEPPVGWNVHEGLLPAPRAWTAPVVALSWRELEALAAELGGDVPAGLWLVRCSEHGGWLSVAAGIEGQAADTVRAALVAHSVQKPTMWKRIQDQLKAELDPKDILNPGLG
ncbi:MAG: FAD-binding oxidoreductase [Myxococcales bacterium]|nr:FAD-binding oxidoreductase [Myxococcales bacterium]MCB9733391.1 FAD-binding oxidoreductase [Deltaproteobacteria bacterium]